MSPGLPLILLLLAPLVGGGACLLAPSRLWWERLNLGAFTLVFGFSVWLGLEVLRSGTVTAWNGYLRADALSGLVIIATAFVSLVCGIYAVGYFRRDERDGRIVAKQTRLYYVLTPWFVGAMLLALAADNLGVMWVAIETTTLAGVLLVTFYNEKTSFEAGWKYIILGGVGVSLALFGTVITYSSAIGVLGDQAHQGLNWSRLFEIADQLDPKAVRLAFVLVVIGYGTKAGLAPMHTWKPDAYAEAPAPAAALLGAGFINCAIYSIMRFDVLAEKCLGHGFPSRMLIGFGVVSILVAAPFVLVQRNFRRLLAYSSIEHAGIMAAAVGFGGALGALGAVLHLLFHSVTKPLMFFCAGDIQQEFGSPLFRKVRGVIHALPWTACFFILAALAVTAIPPFGVFQSELTILAAAAASEHTLPLVLFVGGVVAIFAGFLTHLMPMIFGAASDTPPRTTDCAWKWTAMAIGAAATVVLGFWLPAPLWQLVGQSATILQGAP